MSFFLPAVPHVSTAQRLAGGVEKIGSKLFEALQPKIERKQKQKLLESIDKSFASPQQSVGQQTTAQKLTPEQKKEKFLEALPEIENKIGRELTPEDLDKLWTGMDSVPEFGGQGQAQQQQQPQQQVSESERMMQRARKEAAVGLHDESKISMEQAKISDKRSARKEQQHYDIAKKALGESADKAYNLAQKETTLQSLEDALKTNDLGMFSRDNFAEMTGIEGFRSPEGALFKKEIKELFLGNVGEVGSKGLNQWFEKQIFDMAPRIGRSTEANLVVMEAFRLDTDVEKKKIELTNRIAEQMEEQYGYVRRDLAEQVTNQLRPYAVEKQKESKAKIEAIKEKYQPVNKEGHLMYDPAGNLRRVSKGDYKNALKNNYRVAK